MRVFLSKTFARETPHVGLHKGIFKEPNVCFGADACCCFAKQTCMYVVILTYVASVLIRSSKQSSNCEHSSIYLFLFDRISIRGRYIMYGIRIRVSPAFSITQYLGL